MSIRFARLMVLALMGSCVWGDGPVIYSSASEPYSLANLAKLKTKRIEIPDQEADGTCLTWARYWSPAETDSPPSSLIEGGWSNPWNTNGVLHNWAVVFRIDRVVTEDLDENGFLNHPQSLIDQGIVSPTVEVEFEIIGYIHGNEIVKPWMGDGLNAAFKLISINGKSYWTVPSPMTFSSAEMRLSYNTWTRKTLNIPVSMVKFPKRVLPGDRPKPVENRLEFITDAYPMFGFAIDGFQVAWSKARVKAMAPIFLVHGTNADPTTWDIPKGNSFNDYFNEFQGICFNDIKLTPNGPIDGEGGNADLLELQMAACLYSVGAKQCHIIAHSKGGLDSRGMIYQHYKSRKNISLDGYGNFEVLSLYTLDTPHRGTVLSDITWNALNPIREGDQVTTDAAWEDLAKVVACDFRFFHSMPYSDGPTIALPAGSALKAQMTANMDRWNTTHSFDFSHPNSGGRPIKFYNTAADADWNIRNLAIDTSERKFAIFDISPSLYIGSLLASEVYTTMLLYGDTRLNQLATSMYRILYWAKHVEAKSDTVIKNFNDELGNIWSFQVPVTQLFVPPGETGATWNDLVVPISSAIYNGGTKFCPIYFDNIGGVIMGNHSAIKTKLMASEIIKQITIDWIL